MQKELYIRRKWKRKQKIAFRWAVLITATVTITAILVFGIMGIIKMLFPGVAEVTFCL